MSGTPLPAPYIYVVPVNTGMLCGCTSGTDSRCRVPLFRVIAYEWGLPPSTTEISPTSSSLSHSPRSRHSGNSGNVVCGKCEEFWKTIDEMYQKLGEGDRLVNRYLRVFAVVALYWFVSILTVFVNKHLLSGDDVKLEAPLFVTWFQCVVSALICFVMSVLGSRYPTVVSFPAGNPLDLATFRKILPLSVLFTFMIGTNNLCLKYVGVAFYYIGRSLTTVFNMLLTYLLLRQKTSYPSVVCCVVIVAGFMLGVDQESLTESFSWRGTIFGVLGSFSLALYSIYTKKTLQYVNQEIWLLSYYNNLYSSFLFLPLIIINGELEAIITYEHLWKTWFVASMVLGGVCGFAIGFVTALQIKVTSPLTHNISGTAKACAQTVIATQWFNESKSLLWWISNVVVLVASAAYTRVKQLEMQRQHSRPDGTTQRA